MHGTPNQIRDAMIEALIMVKGSDTTSDDIQAIRVKALEVESVRRNARGRFARCPRCFGHHPQLGNFGHLPEEIAAEPKLAGEALCDQCQETILEFFPDHASVPHIKAAMVFRT